MIADITVSSSSAIKDSVVFDLKGELTTSLNFNDLKFDSSTFGEDATESVDNIFINVNSEVNAISM